MIIIIYFYNNNNNNYYYFVSSGRHSGKTSWGMEILCYITTWIGTSKLAKNDNYYQDLLLLTYCRQNVAIYKVLMTIVLCKYLKRLNIWRIINKFTFLTAPPPPKKKKKKTSGIHAVKARKGQIRIQSACTSSYRTAFRVARTYSYACWLCFWITFLG